MLVRRSTNSKTFCGTNKIEFVSERFTSERFCHKLAATIGDYGLRSFCHSLRSRPSGPVVKYLGLIVAYGVGVARATQPEGSLDFSAAAGVTAGLALMAGLGAFIGYIVVKRRAGDASD